MDPLIFDIKRYAINDGPGIRTTLFMKGCPLHCVWCHNPESWSPRVQLLYKKSKCIGCQSCVEACSRHALKLTASGIVHQADSCILCGQCTAECPTTALELCGKKWDMEALMEEVEKERAIMEESGGGVTICGGEPLMHPEYTLQLLRVLGQRGFHRAVDTTLFCSENIARTVADECELLLVDLKMMNSQRHAFFTGVPNEQILHNIRVISSRAKEFFIRIPLIEGVNTDVENIRLSASFLRSLPVFPSVVNLLPYHDVGKDKHCRMWGTFNPDCIPLSTPSDDTITQCQLIFESFGLKVVLGG